MNKLRVVYPPSKAYLEWQARETRDGLRVWLADYYGDRCEVSCPGCPICEAWQAFDTLFKDIP